MKNMRKEWHSLYQEGKSIPEIALMSGQTEFCVVKTLRNSTPKIEGANYSFLSLPIPEEEILQAYYEGGFKDLAIKYDVSVYTLKKRIPEELPPFISIYPKINVLSEMEKRTAISHFYRGGRKLNSTSHSPFVLKQILKEAGIPEKKKDSLSPKSQIALLDSLLEQMVIYKIDQDKIFELSRKLYEFETDHSFAWRGNILDWLLTKEISEEDASILIKTIDGLKK